MKIFKPDSNFIILFILTITGIFCLYIVYAKNTSLFGFGGGDNISHFLISRYAFQHPCLFFHHWGKPMFTMLSAPFAQAGLYGVYVFNLLVSLSASFLAYKTARLFELKHAWITVLFVLFSPVFFFSATSSLTEPVFSLLLASGIFLFANRQHVWSAIVFSFLILVRTESFVLFPLFIFVYFFSRKWYVIPLLATGSILFSIAGLSCHNSIFWLISESPYSGGASVYGNGTWYFFIANYKNIFGTTHSLMLLSGIFYGIYIYFIKNKYRFSHLTLIFILASGSVFIYLTAHSYVWWKGIGNSFGLLRVMAAVIPAAGIVAAIGTDFFLKYFLQQKSIIQNSFLLLILCTLCIAPFRSVGFPFRPNQDELLMKETAEWLISTSNASKRIFYFNPLLPYLLEKDPWEKNQIVSLMEGTKFTNATWQEGDILIWDAHFAPNEGGVIADTLLHSSNWELLMLFEPENPYRVMGGYEYQIMIFKFGNYAQSTSEKDVNKIKETLRLKRYSSKIPVADLIHSQNIKDFITLNIPDSAVTIDLQTEFYPFVELPYNHLLENHFKALFFSVRIRQHEQTNDNEAYLVFSIETPEANLKYVSVPAGFEGTIEQQEKICSTLIQLPDIINGKAMIKCYIWNKGGNLFDFDDVKILLLK